MPTAAEISADIAELRAARMKLAKGERVDEVWRDGRRLTFGRMTLEGFNALIETMERDLEAATASEAGRSRRRSIGLRWSN